MRKFALHIGLLLFGLVSIMTVLDLAYTEIYKNAPPRMKFQLLRSLKNTKIDYAFLGSSRVDNGINPMVIKEKTGKTAINLGFQASKLNDIYTVLQLFKSYNIQSEKIFIQIDYIFNSGEAHSNMMEYELMPFIRDNAVIKENFSYLDNHQALYYVPFYRYCLYDSKIGFREMILNLLQKKTNVIQNAGYHPLYGIANNEDHLELPKTIATTNIAYDHIKKYCTENNIKPVIFCAPFMKRIKNADFITKLKTKIPELKDYSGLIDDNRLFQNTNHLNDNGATFFTNYLITDLE